MFFESLWHEFALIPEVEAIALGGSRAGTHYDEKSDYDIFIVPGRRKRAYESRFWKSIVNTWRLEMLFGSLRTTVH